MVKDWCLLSIEVKKGVMLEGNMHGLKRFLRHLSRTDLVEIHNATAELIKDSKQ